VRRERDGDNEVQIPGGEPVTPQEVVSSRPVVAVICVLAGAIGAVTLTAHPGPPRQDNVDLAVHALHITRPAQEEPPMLTVFSTSTFRRADAGVKQVDNGSAPCPNASPENLDVAITTLMQGASVPSGAWAHAINASCADDIPCQARVCVTNQAGEDLGCYEVAEGAMGPLVELIASEGVRCAEKALDEE
jgi:hypothetical protein